MASLIREAAIRRYMKEHEKRIEKEAFLALERMMIQGLENAINLCTHFKTVRAEEILGGFLAAALGRTV